MSYRVIFRVAALLIAPALAWAAPLSYVALDLGEVSVGRLIGDGRIVGSAGGSQLVWSRATGWVDRGLPRYWGDPGFVLYTGANDNGQMAGYVFAPGQTEAFLYDDATGLTLLGAPPGYLGSYGVAISNSGNVAGNASETLGLYSPCHNCEAFLYNAATGMTMLGFLPGDVSSVAADVNDAGQVVGHSFGSEGERPFLYTPSGGMVPLGSVDPENPTGRALAINARGQIVGYSSGQAFFYSPETGMIGLGYLPGSDVTVAGAINDHGQVLGWANNIETGGWGFLYGGGVMWDLREIVTGIPAGVRFTPSDINNAGQILAQGSDGHGYLLTATPEPGAWALLAGGLLALGCLRRKRSRNV